MKKITLFTVSLLAGATVMAQCTAGFTYIVNPANNGNVVFTNTTTGTTSNANYNYQFGDGTYDYHNANTNHTYITGTYYACILVSDSASSCNSHFCDSVHVVNNSPPCNASYTAVIDTLANGCTFTSISTGPATTYSWNFGDTTALSTAPNPYHLYNYPGIYPVCLTVSSTTDTACHNTSCSYVTIGPNNNCRAHFSATVGAHNVVQFMNFSTDSLYAGGTSWHFGDGTTGSDSSTVFTHQYASGGIYTVCLTVRATNCISTFCDTIAISTCTASFTAVTDTSNTICTFNSVTSGSPNTYSWTFGDGNTSTQPNPTYTYASGGTYNACLTVSSTVDPACSATYCNNVTVGNFCHANFTVFQDSVVNLFTYLVYNTTTSNTSINSYLWDFGDGTTSTLPYPQHTYANSTPLLLCLTITTVNGCTSTFCDSIHPGHSPNHVTTINVVNPAAGINVVKSAEESLSNYPNPFSTTTTITYTLNHATGIDLYVMDLLGNKVAILESGNKSSGIYKFDFDSSALSPGIYLLQLLMDNNTITKKLVIAK